MLEDLELRIALVEAELKALAEYLHIEFAYNLGFDWADMKDVFRVTIAPESEEADAE
jgi:hypothetical protein